MEQDFQLENHGSLFLLRPLTDRAKEWLRETAPEDAQFMGEAMSIEPRCVENVLVACDDAGMTYGDSEE